MFRHTRLASEMRVYASMLIVGGIMLITATILSGRVSLLIVVGAIFYNVQWLFFRVAAASTPPALIILGSSSTALGRTLHDCRAALDPLRVVSLLDVDESGFLHDINRLDNFRTSEDINWKMMFKVMCNAARVILLDARVDTPALRYEAKEVVDMSSGKSVIVVQQDGKAPLIEQLNAHANTFFRQTATFVEIDEAYDAIKCTLFDQKRQVK